MSQKPNSGIYLINQNDLPWSRGLLNCWKAVLTFCQHWLRAELIESGGVEIRNGYCCSSVTLFGKGRKTEMLSALNSRLPSLKKLRIFRIRGRTLEVLRLNWNRQKETLIKSENPRDPVRQSSIQKWSWMNNFAILCLENELPPNLQTCATAFYKILAKTPPFKN